MKFCGFIIIGFSLLLISQGCNKTESKVSSTSKNARVNNLSSAELEPEHIVNAYRACVYPAPVEIPCEPDGPITNYELSFYVRVKQAILLTNNSVVEISMDNIHWQQTLYLGTAMNGDTYWNATIGNLLFNGNEPEDCSSYSIDPQSQYWHSYFYDDTFRWTFNCESTTATALYCRVKITPGSSWINAGIANMRCCTEASGWEFVGF